ITADCEIMADFSLKTYQVDVQTSAGGNASATNLTIVHGQSGQVTFTANEGYLLQNVTGCGGTLSGNTYTTGPLTTH
ncbi:hypothetical protein JMU72_14910, partial [Mammaliicoccus sciuri]|uniref:hypothetical protein n=1 Tax=Mammaliicoccus sciuri TaxID=1296 RepID=UPI001F11479B